MKTFHQALTVAIRKNLFKEAKTLREAGHYAKVSYKSLIIKRSDENR